MEKIIIKTPSDIKEIDLSEVFRKYTDNRRVIIKYNNKISEENYMHWERAKFIDPPTGFSKTEAWYLSREIRKVSAKATPVRDTNGERFTILRPSYTDKLLRKIDMYAGGHFLFDRTSDTAKSEKQKFLTRGIIEEAIASSQLEGASTTRKYAKKMIAENKKPTNKSEWMILNNYKTLQSIEETHRDKDLSIEMLLELQAMLTENTLHEDERGRFRKDDDKIVVTYSGKIAHIPPRESFVKNELSRLIKYVNNTETFVHPVIKAIIIHFWIGYLHPFVDGNGRLARTLFYWYMIKNDYWAMAYLPISMVIKRAPKQYTYAYIYSEQDNLDLTYFFDYNIKKIVQTIDEFVEYIKKIDTENKEVENKLQSILLTNERQKQSIHFLLSEHDSYLTITSHQNMNGISRGTARSDIINLEKNGLLNSVKVGKYIRYYASEKLKEIV